MYVFRVLLVCFLLLNSVAFAALPTDVTVDAINGDIQPVTGFDLSGYSFPNDDLEPVLTYYRPRGQNASLLLLRSEDGKYITFASRSNDAALEQRLMDKLWPTIAARTGSDLVTSVGRWFQIRKLQGVWMFALPVVAVCLIYSASRLRRRTA